MAEIIESEEVSMVTIEDPQITSLDPNERKLARRLRIERRVEAMRKQNMPEGEEPEEPEVENVNLQRQLEKSADVMDKLLTESREIITNVRVANDSREVDRREEEGIGREKIIEALEEEANGAKLMFEEVASKWFDILKYNDPLAIHEDMEQQKEQCSELINQKDAIIAMLRSEIKEAERKFTRDQRKQNDDITILADRIEKQVKHMRNAYKQELNYLDDVMMEERKFIIETNNKKWEELYKKRELEEKQQTEKKFEQQEEFVNEVDKLRVQHQEKFRETKIRLEKEVEELQREFEAIKTAAIMNNEKLDYNYQILKKREDENLILNSQQKRRINKLQDVANILRKRNREYDEHTKAEIVRLTKEVKKLQKSVIEIESKAVSLSKINDLKYRQVWDLNVGNAGKVTGKISMIDRILHEQQMGLEWKKIDGGLLAKEQLPSYSRASDAIMRQDSKSSGETKYDSKSNKSVPVKSPTGSTRGVDSTIRRRGSDLAAPKDPKSYDRLLRHIMKQIADRSGFLLESRLEELLSPYCEYERNLVNIDNVFAALGIKEEENIDQMVGYFMPYAKCPICVKSAPGSARGGGSERISIVNMDADDDSASTETEIEHGIYATIATTVCQPEDVITNIVKELVVAKEGSQSTLSGDTEVTTDECMPPIVKSEEIIGDNSAVNTFKKSSHLVKVGCKYNHPLQISPVYVIRAMREFLSDFFLQTTGVESLAARLSQKHTTVSRLMADEDIKLFWDKYKNFFNSSRLRLWDGLFIGLQKYYEILKDRRKLNDEVLCLRKENLELQHLLARYNQGAMRKPPCALQRELPITGQPPAKCEK